MSNEYIIFYLLTNILGTYVIFRYFNIFFKNMKRTNKHYLWGMSFIYYICISLIHLIIADPKITMISNLLLFYMISLLYENTFKKRVFSVLMIYLVLLFSECVSVLAITLFTSNNVIILGFAMSQFISLLLLELLNRRYYLKEDILIPKLQSIILFIFPLGAMILFYNSINYAPDYVSFVNLIILLLFIILIYFIFDEINKNYKIILNQKVEYSNKLLEMRMYEQEKKSYQNQYEIIEKKEKEIGRLKHDMKNHILGLQQLWDNGNKEEFQEYIERMGIFNDDDIINTGNVMFDSILNYKISQAKNKGITVNVDIQIPTKLDIESFDVNVILGNLLQNSIEALEYVEGEKYINFIMDYKMSCLYIMIENPYYHVLKQNDDFVYISTKNDIEKHGIGLESVKRSIARYNGDIEIETSNKLFKVSLFLYL